MIANNNKKGSDNVFYKDVNLNNRNEMIRFLVNHFRYYTMNSWNRMSSYANNVKLHNLDIPGELSSKAYDFISCDSQGDFYWDVKDLIADFTAETGYSAGFNGRSDGYIVMYDTDINDKLERYTLMRGIDENELFDDWSTKSIAERVNLVQRFDRLCDDIFHLFLDYVEHVEIKDVEVVRKEMKRIAVMPEDWR